MLRAWSGLTKASSDSLITHSNYIGVKIMNWIKGIMTAGIAALSMGAALDVHAADGKTFPATFCQAESVAVSMDYRGSGKARNPSNSTMRVVCPVVRDSMNGNVRKANVYVIDRHYSRNVSCTLNSINKSATTGWFQTKSTNGSSNNIANLSFGARSAHSFGIYFFRCSVPGKYQGQRSEIASYYMEER